MQIFSNYINDINLLNEQKSFLNQLMPREKNNYLLSLKNYIERKQSTNEKLYKEITQGDVCYFDFGHGYEREIGYQHLGIVLTKSQYKLFVVPLVSLKSNPTLEDVVNLMQSPIKSVIPKGKGELTNDTIAYINDAKWINYIRTIRIIGHIDNEGATFKTLKKKTIALLCGNIEGDSYE